MSNRLAARTTQSGVRLPEFAGVAPRCSISDASRHRGNFVTIVASPENFDPSTVSFTLKDILEGKSFQLLDVTELEVSQINEFVCYVNPQTGVLHYHSHGTYNDDFDKEAYSKLVQVMKKVPGLF